MSEYGVAVCIAPKIKTIPWEKLVGVATKALVLAGGDSTTVTSMTDLVPSCNLIKDYHSHVNFMANA